MDDPKIKDSTEDFEQALKKTDESKYLLRLFVAGTTQRSNQAIEAIKQFCERELKGRYELEVIDIYQQPELIKDEQILAAPTLIRKLPLPLRKIIGNLTDAERVLVGLDLRPKEK